MKVNIVRGIDIAAITHQSSVSVRFFPSSDWRTNWVEKKPYRWVKNVKLDKINRLTDTTVVGRNMIVMRVITFTAAASFVPFSVRARIVLFSSRLSSASIFKDSPFA